MQTIHQYPHLKRVALEIAYDNDMLQQRTEDEWLATLDPVIGGDGVYHADLMVWDEWLGTLSDAEIQIVAAGEHSEQVALMAMAPDPVQGDPSECQLAGLLNDIFEAE